MPNWKSRESSTKRITAIKNGISKIQSSKIAPFLEDAKGKILKYYESEKEKQRAIEIANNYDFVIYGSAPFEYIKNRIKNRKWTFIYSERLFKESRAKDLFNIKTILACTLRYSFASHKRLRLLCSSAFSSNDFKYFRFKENHTYKWGYFPPQSELSYSELDKKKEPNNIVWVGRMIHWKHPELVIQLAKKLKDNNIEASVTIVGDGVMIQELKHLAGKYCVSDKIIFKGVLSTSQTREEMEKASILVTTSDHNEGWGAIVNEGMSSGCAVVASHLMGSVPFLIKDKENGFVFESENIDDLYKKVKYLCDNPEKRVEMGKAAYETITKQWCAENATQRLYDIIKSKVEKTEEPVYKDGPCSKAEIITPKYRKGNYDKI